MADIQGSERQLEMERALHRYVWGPWSSDHAGRPGSEIGQLEYDRDLRPEQRLETHKTPMRTLPTYLLPGRLMSLILERKLADTYGSGEVARSMIRSFDRPASRTDDTPLLEKLDQALENHETVSLVDSHAEFTGGVRLMTALSAALGKSRYIRRNYVIISNTMTREKVRNKSIADLISPVAHIVWVNPDTDSYKKLIEKQGLDEETAELIEMGGNVANAGGMKEIIKVTKGKGGLLQWAPFSSAVERVLDSNGKLAALKAPNLPDQAPGLLGRSRYALPVAYWPDPDSSRIKWTIGDLHDREAINVGGRHVRDGIYIERVVGELCTMLSELAEVPVEQGGKVFPLPPHQIDAAPAGTL
jgi:hypothetical protein